MSKALSNAERDAIAARYRPDVPLFRDLGQCMKWAWYGVRHDADTVGEASMAGWLAKDFREQIDEPKQARRAPPAVRTARRPKKYAAAAQAGMLKAFLKRLTPLERNHLQAKYLSGWIRNSARRRVAQAVYGRVKSKWFTMDLCSDLVADYYGKPTEHKELLEKHKIGQHRFNRARRAVQITLDAVSAKAEGAAYDHFQKGGVLA